MTISMDSGKTKTFTEINRTPLTDIVLVLMIMMMVLAPMFQQSDPNIKLPPILTGGQLEENTAILEISKAGEYKLNGTAIAESALQQKLTELPKETKAMPLVLRADGDTQSSAVMVVYDMASEAGFEKMSVAGEPANRDNTAANDSPL